MWARWRVQHMRSTFSRLRPAQLLSLHQLLGRSRLRRRAWRAAGCPHLVFHPSQLLQVLQGWSKHIEQEVAAVQASQRHLRLGVKLGVNSTYLGGVGQAWHLPHLLDLGWAWR